jgi:hypothetical protein
VGWPLKKTFLGKAQTYHFTLLGLKIATSQVYVEALPCRARGIQNIKKKGPTAIIQTTCLRTKKKPALLQQNPLKKIEKNAD